MQERIARYIKIFFGLLVLYLLWQCTSFLYVHHYSEIVDNICGQLYLPELADAYKASSKWQTLFKVAKVLVLLVDGVWAYRMYRVMTDKGARLVSRYYERIFTTVGDSLWGTYHEVRNSPPYIRLGLAAILVIQLVVFTKLLFTLPYHYDEIFTYTNFSSKGFLASMAYYHVPNNHILHNLISVFFLTFPIDALTGIRLVSYIAAFVSTIYFFKLARAIMPGGIAVVITALFTFSYPIVYYSVQARGYSVLTMCALLCMYSFIMMASGGSNRKYMGLYTVCSIAGFYTIPSFLYFFLVINVLLLLHVVIRFRAKAIIAFVVANVIIGGSTILLYTPVVLRNTWQALIENNGVIKRDAEFINAHLKGHLYQLRDFMTGSSSLGFDWVYLLIGFAALLLLHKRYAERFAGLMIAALLLSPGVIIRLHQTIPFPRTWIFLMIPLCLSAGVMVFMIVTGLRLVTKNRVSFSFARPVVLAIVFIISCTMLARFDRRFEEQQQIDIIVKKYNELLGDKVVRLRNYSYTFKPGGDLSFYLAESFNFEKLRHSTNGKPLVFGSLSSWSDNPVYDIIVLHKKDPEQNIDYNQYDKVEYDNDYFIVYTRKGL